MQNGPPKKKVLFKIRLEYAYNYNTLISSFINKYILYLMFVELEDNIFYKREAICIALQIMLIFV